MKVVVVVGEGEKVAQATEAIDVSVIFQQADVEFYVNLRPPALSPALSNPLTLVPRLVQSLCTNNPNSLGTQRTSQPYATNHDTTTCMVQYLRYSPVLPRYL